MKNRLFTLAIIMMTFSVKAQITLEATYNHSGTYTKLANSGYKYYIMDVDLNQCRLYNTNHTLWKTISLSIPVNHYLYDIRFVSENLFTTDNSLCLAYIYYNYNATGQYYTYTAKVVKENGTELLTVAGCQYIYVYNLNGIGTKMFTYSYDYSNWPYAIQTRTYNLPGELITGAPLQNEEFPDILEAFPNPAHDYLTIHYELPEGVFGGELVMNDIHGQVIKTMALDNHGTEINLHVAQYPSGVYFYIIRAGNYQSNTEKLIIH